MGKFNEWDGEEPFGEMAIRLGFCTAKDVRQALNYQHELQAEQGEDRKIGLIMMEKGILTSEQVTSILHVLEEQDEQETT